jgi:hypothetical protein
MKRALTLSVLLGVAVSAATLTGVPREARASVSVAVTFEGLVRGACAVALGTAGEQRSVWEGERIYTYSRVHVDSSVAGELKPEDETWVRTLGGVVGEVGQRVEGEAVFTVGRPSLVFLKHDRMGTGTYVVTARAQGQFGLYLDEKSAVHVQKSNAMGTLFAPQGPNAHLPLASDVIHGRPMTDAAKDIGTAWSRQHAP